MTDRAQRPPPDAPGAVSHGLDGAGRPGGRGGAESRSCARCGAPVPATSRGLVRRDARYCSPECRRVSTVIRRAAARGQLRAALLDVEAALARARAAARTLGILPDRPRRSRPRVA